MMFNCTLASFVSRVKIGHAHGDLHIVARYSKLLLNVLDILLREGCIISYSVEASPVISGLNVIVYLKYFRHRPVIRDIKVVSTPGSKVYWTLRELSVKSGRNTFNGFYLISTIKGIFTSNDALLIGYFSYKISGEILLKIEL